MSAPTSVGGRETNRAPLLTGGSENRALSYLRGDPWEVGRDYLSPVDADLRLGAERGLGAQVGSVEALPDDHGVASGRHRDLLVGRILPAGREGVDAAEEALG